MATKKSNAENIMRLAQLGATALKAGLGAQPSKVANTGLWSVDYALPKGNTSANSTTNNSINKNTSVTNGVNAMAKSAVNTSVPTYNYKSNINNVLSGLQNQYKPKEVQSYSSAYENQINNLINSITNQKDFSYNVESDPLYNQYKNQYSNQGKEAMQQSMAEAATLTGGYGSSYAQTAGNQSYQSYLDKLNNVVPELYQVAYGQYKQKNDNLYDQLNMYGNLEKTAYNKYLDNVSQANIENKSAYQQLRDKISDANALEEQNYKNYLSQYNSAVKQAQAYETAQAKFSSGSSSSSSSSTNKASTSSTNTGVKTTAAQKNKYYKQMKDLINDQAKENRLSMDSKETIAKSVRSAYANGYITAAQMTMLMGRVGFSI
ncbi:MAG: hypothetical protein GX896_10290 [Clostridiales bacterium]|nr:hypothetical protein [Clostridiales bacterium]